MRIRPGRNLLRSGAALAACSLAVFIWLPIGWLLVLGLLSLGVLCGLEYRELKHRFGKVQVARTLPIIVGRDRPFEISFRLTNEMDHGISGTIRDELPAHAVPNVLIEAFQVAPHEQQTIRNTLHIPVRGRHEFGPVWLRLEGRWRLLEGHAARDCHGAVKVLPEVFSSKEGLNKDQQAEMLLQSQVTRSRQRGVGTEFESLSEFREGDDPRRIDWRSTARFRRPIVRRFQVERHRDVMIVIDCGRLMGADSGDDRGTKLDCAVDSGLMLGRVALESGDRCGTGVFDDQVIRYLPPIAGVASLRTLIEGMYDLQSRLRESDFSIMFSALQSRQPKRSLVVVISDIGDAETSIRLRTSLAQLAKRHVVLFAALRTPLLHSIIHAPVSSFLDGSRKAVALRILREREKSIHSVRRSGVHVVDVEPSQLTVPLINHFIMLRHNNL